MIIIIDNYDSFTYNIVDYVMQLTSKKVVVYRHDERSVAAILAEKPDKLIISPGPKTPTEAGISLDLIRAACQTPEPIPVLGVCLGHQAIGAAFGAKICRAPVLMHGKTSMIQVIAASYLFNAIPNPFEATRYHSLVIDPDTIPACLQILARAQDDNSIMAIAHRVYPLVGVQFHPESILTTHGMTLLRNFI